MVRFLAERSDTKSNVKLGGLRSQLQASYVSSHTKELWYNETVCLWMTIYKYIYIYICIYIYNEYVVSHPNMLHLYVFFDQITKVNWFKKYLQQENYPFGFEPLHYWSLVVGLSKSDIFFSLSVKQTRLYIVKCLFNILFDSIKSFVFPVCKSNLP